VVLKKDQVLKLVCFLHPNINPHICNTKNHQVYTAHMHSRNMKAFNVKKFTYDLLKKDFWQESECPNTYLLHHYQMASGANMYMYSISHGIRGLYLPLSQIDPIELMIHGFQWANSIRSFMPKMNDEPMNK